MGKQYLIDSNVVIDYLAGKFNETGMLFMNGIISVITKIPDAIIAATSLATDSVILTRNLKDFQIIKGVECINPHNL